MNNDKNDVALDQAPATVDGKQVLSVLQITISDIPAEDGYKVLLKDASSAVVPLADFQPGASVTTDDTAPATLQTAELAVGDVEYPTPPAQPIDNTQVPPADPNHGVY